MIATSTERPVAGGSGGARRFELELPPSDVAATVARSALRRVLDFIDDDRESSFLVALTEIVTNAVDEHRRSAPGESLIVEVVLDGDPVVRVIDHGSGLDELRRRATAATPPAPDDRAGRGLVLAQSFVPALSFEVTSGGTTAVLPLSGFARPR